MKSTNEVSKLAGDSRRTLQYYDDEGIFVVERSSNNYRMYDQKALKKIWQILVYKEMNFQLKEIKYLLVISNSQKKRYLEKRKEAIRKQIIKLKMQMEFVSLVQIYGMPLVPIEGNRKTYMSSIEELREKIRTKVLKGEEKQ